MSSPLRIPRGKPPPPALNTSHDVRYLVVCAYVQCRELGGSREMIVARATDYQSRANGDALYHGRCFAKKFGAARFLRLPRSVLGKLTIGDVGPSLAMAISDRRRRGRKRTMRAITATRR